MKRPVPLNALRSFEAAGRHLSLSAAAQELNVTPAAVSHQIKALEDHLQAVLFTRTHRAVSLTAIGSAYLSEVSKHLSGLQQATDRLREQQERKTVRIQVHATIAQRWLIPRLSSFHTAHPEIAVKLTTALPSINFDDGEFDCGIQLGRGDWKGLKSHPLVVNEITPACSPAFKKKHALTGNVAELSSTTLLHSLSRPDDWSHWLSTVSASDIDAYKGLKYDSSVLAYQAAVESQGLVMAQRVLIEGDIEAGRLVTPFSEIAKMGAYTYYFIYPSRANQAPELDTFRKWILAEAAVSNKPKKKQNECIKPK